MARQQPNFLPYLYGAYGMNTSLESMATRCPAAEPAGTLRLLDYALAFRGVADIVPAKRRVMHIALWKITSECEKSLDALEGFRKNGGGLYDKLRLRITSGRHSGRLLMLYQMTRRDLAPPSEGYESMLREGYHDFGMPAKQIDKAIAEAKKAKRERIWTPSTRPLWSNDYDVFTHDGEEFV